MTLNPQSLLAFLDRHEDLSGRRRFVVAFSGGLDSTVLLDLARRGLPRRPGADLLAVHIDHGLQPESPDWARHCRAITARFGVACESRAISAGAAAGESPEAAARVARYAALQRFVEPGDVLLTAHHQDDQLETVLLQLLRGAGVAGLAGMPGRAAFGEGWHLRPLLDYPRSAVLDYATGHGLDWIDDPANAANRFDRNYLRRHVVPAIVPRWAGAPTAIGRAARHCAAAARVLDEVAAADLRQTLDDTGCLDVNRLRDYTRDRQANLLRHWISGLRLPTPTTAQVQQMLRLPDAAPDAESCVSWPGGELRRYRRRLYAMTPLQPQPENFSATLSPAAGLALPGGLGALRVVPVRGDGLDAGTTGLRVRFRAGGERLRPQGSDHRRELRNLFQESGVVPWMRARIPLIYAGERLVAVADLWLDREATAGPDQAGLKIIWDNHPPLY